MTRRPRTSRKVLFSSKLALHTYMLGLFGVETLQQLGNHIKDPSHEGRTEDGVSRFHLALVALLPSGGRLTADQLLTYDENIHRHTESINRKRVRPIEWKYFQYLSLLFTEIYLDAYFRDADGLRDALNEHLVSFNEKLADIGVRDAITPYDDASLRKVAFWNATGSGKTLIMHMNIHQYRHYLNKAGRTGDLNRIVLLTPREGLSHQHLEEFKDSGMPAAAFDKDRSVGGFLSGKIIDVIDMHKLKEEGKQKTVSVDAFETNNLVLIDEGHRGAKGDVWFEMRQRLSRNGFVFEYSATLGQALAQDKDLTDEYAKAILFDYSYRHFYADGYGKDFTILNIDDEQVGGAEEKRRLYLTACLLTYYQQLRLFEERGTPTAERSYCHRRRLLRLPGGLVGP